MRVLIVIIIIFITGTVHAQLEGPIDHRSDILLQNRYIMIEATQAIDDMYNFKFDKAAGHFKFLKKQYPWHPLPVFLLGLNEWWKIIPNIRDEQYDNKFLAYMDTSLLLSEKLYEERNKIEGAFFLTATYAFVSRYHGERGSYTKSAVTGRLCLKYLEEIRGQDAFSPEILFGDGLFNYYAEWIRENYPILRPLLAFFPDGDQKLGLEQLEETARNAFYSRTEAQYFLMRILYEEGELLEALQIAKYLRDTYPDNAYFHRYYTRLLYHGGKREELVEESKLILERIASGMEGYEGNSGRYASFYLGQTHERWGQLDEAFQYYTQCTAFAEELNMTDRGYYFYSLLHLGIIEEKQDNPKAAIDYYKRVRKVSKRKHSANEEARERIRKLRKMG